MRIGLFGGTFNPVHNGHLALAGEALFKLRLDKIIFVPAYIPVHKAHTDVIGAEDRIKMIELAIKAKAEFGLSRYEVDRGKKTYSVETVKYFRRIYPKGTEFFFLAGADSLSDINSWKDINKLLGLSKFIAFSRPGFSKDNAREGIELMDMKGVDISSTQIRGYIRENRPIDNLVPGQVAGYILKNNLYKTGEVDNV